MRLPFPLLLAAALASCSSLGRARALEADLAEAAFRYAIGEVSRGSLRAGSPYCLKVPGGDPAPAFLARFKEEAVQAAAACTGGVRLSVEKVVRVSEREYALTMKLNEGPMQAAAYEYRLRLEGGRWTVFKTTLIWVS